MDKKSPCKKGLIEQVDGFIFIQESSANCLSLFGIDIVIELIANRLTIAWLVEIFVICC